MSKKELRAPDKFEETLDRAWKRIEPHRTKVLVIAGLLVVLAVGLSVMGWMSGKATQASADAQRAALSPLTAPIIAPDDAPAVDPEKPRPAPRGEVYESQQAALAAAEAGLAKYLADRPDGAAAAAVRFAQSIIKIPAGKPADAAAGLEKWIAENPESPLLTSALDHLAIAQAAAGQLDKAKATYAKLAEQTTGLGKAMALTALGDLSNPLIVAAGDAVVARKHYEAAQQALGPKPEAGADLIAMVIQQPYLYAELDTKLAALP